MSLSAIADEGGGNNGNNGNNSGQQQGNNGNNGNQGNNGNSGNHENGEEGEEDEGDHEGGSGGNHEDGDHQEGEEGGGQGNNSAYIMQIGGNNRAYINQESVHNGIASIVVNGDNNNAYIMQKGNGGISGFGYEVGDFDVCSGFSPILPPDEEQPLWDVSTAFSNIELVCGGELVITDAGFSFHTVAPGIYITGDNNKASIEQRGKTGIAGIRITGDKNGAKIDQCGNSGQAYIDITSAKLSDGTKGLTAVISQQGKTNFAYSILKGVSNDPTIHAGSNITQHGNSNSAFQYSEGDNIRLGVTQEGGFNTARQINVGDHTFMGIAQSGSQNIAVEMSTGNYNNSYIQQDGSRNEALILQGNPAVTGVTVPTITMN
ncbi:hypothetical protein JCM18694_17960 [Prolixibacter denitrificans]|nr:hypothetical protein JCM18694_17960 [Prolixibacter denitrificans]